MIDDTKALVFLHMPKTAGTSLGRALSAMFSPEHRHFQHGPLQGIRPDDIRFVWGHYYLGDLVPLFPDAMYVTLLRDPRAAMVSLYTFFMNTPDEIFYTPGWEKYAQVKTDSIAQFIAKCQSELLEELDNPYVRRVVRGFPEWNDFFNSDSSFRDRQGALQFAQAKLENFSCVGLVEFMDESVRKLEHNIFSGQRLNMPHVNHRLAPETRPSGAVFLMPPLTVGEEDAIHDLTRLDEALYWHFLKKSGWIDGEYADEDDATRQSKVLSRIRIRVLEKRLHRAEASLLVPGTTN